MFFLNSFFTVSDRKILKKRNNVFSKKINGFWKVIKTGDEYVFIFNKGGGYIWELIEVGTYSINDIVLSYSKKYRVPIDKTKDFVGDFISECINNNLIK